MKIRVAVDVKRLGHGHLLKGYAVLAAGQEIISKAVADRTGLEVEYSILSEKDLYSPVSNFLWDILEQVYNLATNWQCTKKVWDSITQGRNDSSVGLMYRVQSRLNRPNPLLERYDAFISTHPGDIASIEDRISAGVPNINLWCDRSSLESVCNLYTISRTPSDLPGANIYHAVVDEEMRAQLLSRFNASFHSPAHVIPVGLYTHPDALSVKERIITEGLEPGIHHGKTQVILPISGAGVQKCMYLGILAGLRDDMNDKKFDHMSPLFVAFSRTSYFLRLVTAARILGVINNREYAGSVKAAWSKPEGERPRIFTYKSGLKILFDPDKDLCLKHLDRLKAESAFAVCKPGDTTSGGVYLYMPVAGGQELDNADFSIERGFSVMPRCELTGRIFSIPLIGDIIYELRYGRMISKRMSEMLRSKGFIKMRQCLYSQDDMGAVRVAGLGALAGAMHCIDRGELDPGIYRSLSDAIQGACCFPNGTVDAFRGSYKFHTADRP